MELIKKLAFGGSRNLEVECLKCFRKHKVCSYQKKFIWEQHHILTNAKHYLAVDCYTKLIYFVPKLYANPIQGKNGNPVICEPAG